MRLLTWALVLLSAATLGFAGDARAGTFACGAPDCPVQIVDNPTFPATGDTSATPYPSTIVVSGLSGTVSKVTVTLNGYTHSFPDDVDVLLVGPTGTAVELMSDAGTGNDVAGATLTFDDGASGMLPDEGVVSTGTYRPSNFSSTLPDDQQNGCALEPPTAGNTDQFPAPAPIAPTGGYAQTLNTLNGTAPNGTWKLFVGEDCTVDDGSLAGWSINIDASGPTAVTLAGFDVAASGSLVEVEWRSAAEVGVLGYNLVRTDRGRKTRLNRTLIASRGSGSAYRYVDRMVRPGRNVYRLEIVSSDGSRRWAARAVVLVRP